MTEEPTVSSEILRALGYLIIATVAYITYQIGRRGLGRERRGLWGESTYIPHEDTATRDVIMRLLKGFGLIIAIAFVAAYVFLGTTSDCTEADPIYGGCVTTQEREPSSEERAATVAYWMVLLGVPYLMGGIQAHSAVKHRETKGKAKPPETS